MIEKVVKKSGNSGRVYLRARFGWESTFKLFISVEQKRGKSKWEIEKWLGDSNMREMQSPSY